MWSDIPEVFRIVDRGDGKSSAAFFATETFRWAARETLRTNDDNGDGEMFSDHLTAVAAFY